MSIRAEPTDDLTRWRRAVDRMLAGAVLLLVVGVVACGVLG